MTYVISKSGKPLMPCCDAISRILRKQGKAKVLKREPFTIQLLYETTEYTQPLKHGMDSGSATIGSAVSDESGQILYVSEIQVRNDIKNKMDSRRKYRRNRRNRKTRYRKPRWNNRKNSKRKDRFSPTMISKFNAHIKEINFVKRILPITKLIIETGTFDPHALKNPEVFKNKSLYQKGQNYGYANTHAYVLHRDNYICQQCKGKRKNEKLEVHHIIERSNNGSDESENLITLCKICHDDIHNGLIKLKGGKHKGTLNHATQMNSIKVQLLRLYPKAIETFGYITKMCRQKLNLEKTHYIDASVIASKGKPICFKTNIIIQKKCVSDGDYQQTKGIRSEMKIPTDKIMGFRKFDKVRYNGKEYFIKGRMSTGYAVLMDINGEKLTFNRTPKLKNMHRIAARKSWIIQQKNIFWISMGNASEKTILEYIQNQG